MSIAIEKLVKGSESMEQQIISKFSQLGAEITNEESNFDINFKGKEFDFVVYNLNSKIGLIGKMRNYGDTNFIHFSFLCDGDINKSIEMLVKFAGS